MTTLLRAAVALFFVLALPAFSLGEVVLGTGTASLLGGDLTDPEDDGDPEANINYNATFAASSEPTFGGTEGAFNVFDNQAGAGNAKWCCNAPTQWVQATFSEPYVLTHFTITSANDTPARNPIDWQIQGSNDGVTFTNIFTHTGSDVFTTFNQTILFDAGDYAGQGNTTPDFALPDLFSTFRFQVTAHGGDGAGFQLGELEFFGIQPPPPLTPEPTSLALFVLAIAVMGKAYVRRRVA